MYMIILHTLFKKYFMRILYLLLFFASTIFVNAQGNITYWQQHVDYNMEVAINEKDFKYSGTQKLVYTNNSPDVLHHVFYHLYFNAFQPGSEMDARLQNIIDPDYRMVKNIGTANNPIFESKISKLKPKEIGYLNVTSLKQNGIDVNHEVKGTVLKAYLNEPIQPGESVMFNLEFEGQVPVLIRRSGRNSEDGVALSMGQWYPKMAEYDFEGWHADAYIGREFHGVWGNFDVTLHIDKKYTVAATGVLQNPQEVGHGYEDESKKLNKKKGKKLTWNFIANNVHDFTWAADDNYSHDILKTESGTKLHFFYKDEDKYRKAWKDVQPLTAKALAYFNENIGDYPWEQYSVIQGGDGGMEYAMCTLVQGGESLGSIVGTVFHELAHSWFQQLLATNELKHSWMDEGFATYISTVASTDILGQKSKNISNSFESYSRVVKYGIEEPLTTHADKFYTNTAYDAASYSKGFLFMSQLNYILGEDNVQKTIKQYYNAFKFKHPTPNDFIRVAEKVSGLQLDWYLNEWIKTTHIIDYAVTSIEDNSVTLVRSGQMPMPIDITVTYTDGTSEEFHIPLRMMRGVKPTSAIVLKDWAWSNPKYTFNANKLIEKVEIDPLNQMADINRDNNSFKNINN